MIKQEIIKEFLDFHYNSDTQVSDMEVAKQFNKLFYKSLLNCQELVQQAFPVVKQAKACCTSSFNCFQKEALKNQFCNAGNISSIAAGIKKAFQRNKIAKFFGFKDFDHLQKVMAPQYGEQNIWLSKKFVLIGGGVDGYGQSGLTSIDRKGAKRLVEETSSFGYGDEIEFCPIERAEKFFAKNKSKFIKLI